MTIGIVPCSASSSPLYLIVHLPTGKWIEAISLILYNLLNLTIEKLSTYF